MTYRIKPEHIGSWGADASIETELTEDEVIAVADGWGMSLSEIMDQVYPNTPEEVRWYKWMAER